MAEHKSVRLECEELDAIEDMQKRDLADNASEAHRRLLRSGMRAYGYKAGEFGETPLKRVSAEFSRAFAWIGVGWLALTLAAPLEWRLGAVAALSAALACSGVYVALDRWEPRVSKALRIPRRGDNA